MNRKYILAILISTIAIFTGSVFQRHAYLGKLSDGHHQMLTATTVLTVENWIEDGFFKNNGLSIWVPKSIEASHDHERRVYASYPTGAAIEILLLKYIFPKAQTISIISAFGLINQLLIALCCIGIVLICCRKIEGKFKYYFSWLSGFAYITLNTPFYWHATVFFPDQAIILPFAIIILLESIIRTANNHKSLFISQSIMIGIAASIDYLTFPLIGILFIFRLIAPLDGRTFNCNYAILSLLQLVIPASMVISVFLYVLHKQGHLVWLFNNMLYRSGVTSAGASYVPSFFSQYFFSNHGLGLYETIFFITSLTVSIIFFRIAKSTSSIISLIGLICCFCQVLILRNHSVIHDFSALKFCLPISYCFFGILPIAILDKLFSLLVIKKYIQYTFASLTFIFLVTFLIKHHQRWEQQFPAPFVKDSDIAMYIRQHHQYNDVFIGSKDFYIGIEPLQKLSISRKLVHNFKSEDNYSEFIKNLPPESNILYILKDNWGCLEKFDSSEQIGSTKFYIAHHKNLIDKPNFSKCLIN